MTAKNNDYRSKAHQAHQDFCAVGIWGSGAEFSVMCGVARGLKIVQFGAEVCPGCNSSPLGGLGRVSERVPKLHSEYFQIWFYSTLS